MRISMLLSFPKESPEPEKALQKDKWLCTAPVTAGAEQPPSLHPQTVRKAAWLLQSPKYGRLLHIEKQLMREYKETPNKSGAWRSSASHSRRVCKERSPVAAVDGADQ